MSDYLIYTPIWGWQLSPESVAAFEWNGWQASSGISGRLGPEYAAKDWDEDEETITKAEKQEVK
jgi:hypothetical protein